MADETKPLVSIGVPVFNGEAGLRAALDSLLRQDYGNLEIVISDNASTDGTRVICEEFARRDSRVKYHRTSGNFGAIWNFNRVFALSSGQYFMWAAHDDQRESSFVSACVARLESCPDAVLCQSYTAVLVEGRPELLCVAKLDSFDNLDTPAARYRESLSHFPATAIYGLYRASSVRKTRLLNQSIASDLAFIQELSIHGDFVQVPELLFRYVGRTKWNTIHQDYLFFLGKPNKPWWYSPFVALFWNHCHRIVVTRASIGLKMRLIGILTIHELQQLLLKTALRVSGWIGPERWKEKRARGFYLRWMLGPNVVVTNESLFFERVMKPALGWWR